MTVQPARLRRTSTSGRAGVESVPGQGSRFWIELRGAG
jgi:hypothetical protein